MKNKIKAIWIFLCLFISIIPAQAFAVGSAETSATTYQNVVPAEAAANKAVDLIVNGAQVTDSTGAATANISDATAGWRYDSETNTLTLENAVIDTFSSKSAGIYYNGGDLIIKLIGESRIDVRNIYNGAIFTSITPYINAADLYIVGDGSLETSGQIRGYDGILSISGGAVLKVPRLYYDEVSIIESSIVANGTEQAIFGSLNITITKSNIKVDGNSSGIVTNGALNISDSEITINATNGISMKEQPFEIVNSVIDVTSSDTTLFALASGTITNSFVKLHSENYSALDIDNEALTIRNSQVLGTSGTGMSNSANETLTDSLYQDNNTVALSGNVTLIQSVELPSAATLNVPEGSTLTVPEKVELSALGGIESNGVLTFNGAVELPATATKDEVVALGIAGTGSVKLGRAVLSTAGECVTHGSASDHCDGCGELIIANAFPDANFRSYIAATFDIDADGVLSSEEIAVVISINVTGKWISDLSGIEYFTELTELDLTTNNLTSIDISALSKLTILNVRNNTYLETLNLSGNLALEQLNISDCTSLRSLDLSNNINLSYLEANRCALTSLDLSHSGAGLIDGSNSSTYITHCGVGYVNMNLLGDVTRMEITSGGTMGEDGWLLLDPNAANDYGYIWIRYNYDTGNGDGNGSLPVEIRVIHDDFSHTYVANTTSKDETHHYTQMCETCHTGNETTVETHTIKYDYTTKYTNSQHREYCTDCDYLITEACNYASDCEEICSECRLTTRIFFWEEHTLIYTTYIDGDDDSSNDCHEVRCANCSSLNYASEFCYYAFACTEACVCGRANPGAVAHTSQLVANANGTHNKVCAECGELISENDSCQYFPYEKEEFLISPANCNEQAQYYYSCACGNRGSQSFGVGDLNSLNHTGTNDKLVSGNDGTHDVLWSCCDAVAFEKVVCTVSDPNGTCLTDDVCLCGYVIAEAREKHTGGVATCTKPARCAVCGVEYGEPDKDNHASDTFTYTDCGLTHSKTHACCGEREVYEGHTYENGSCVCGASEPVKEEQNAGEVISDIVEISHDIIWRSLALLIINAIKSIFG